MTIFITLYAMCATNTILACSTFFVVFSPRVCSLYAMRLYVSVCVVMSSNLDASPHLSMCVGVSAGVT